MDASNPLGNPFVFFAFFAVVPVLFFAFFAVVAVLRSLRFPRRRAAKVAG
jgi:hypothetical protein